jgi:hypothetical protein
MYLYAPFAVRQILKVVSGSKAERPSEYLIKRICHHLDAKCRIEVE